jgi:hypothetical protein
MGNWLAADESRSTWMKTAALPIPLLHSRTRPVEPVPTLVAFGSPPPNPGFSGRRLARFRIRPRAYVGKEVIVREPVLALQQSLEIGRQFPGAESRPFLDTDPVFQKERKVGAHDVTNCWGPLLNAVESIDPKSLGLIEPHIP